MLDQSVYGVSVRNSASALIARLQDVLGDWQAEVAKLETVLSRAHWDVKRVRALDYELGDHIEAVGKLVTGIRAVKIKRRIKLLGSAA